MSKMWQILITWLVCAYLASVGYLIHSVHCTLKSMRLSERLLSGTIPCPPEWRPFLKLNDPPLERKTLVLAAVSVAVIRLWMFLLLKVVLFVGCFVPESLLPFTAVIKFTCKHIVRAGLGITVEEIGECSSQVSTVVSNHVSMWDAYVIIGQGHDMTLVASAGVMKMPVIGRACRRLGCLFVDRRDGNSRQDAQAKIDEFQRRQTPDGQKLLVFPEGTCSNQTGVLRFKLGAFRGLRPVQPVRIEYAYRQVAFVATHSELSAAGVCFCLPTSQVRLTWLSPVFPLSGESAQDFADRVRTAVSDSNRLPLLDSGYGDNIGVEDFFVATPH